MMTTSVLNPAQTNRHAHIVMSLSGLGNDPGRPIGVGLQGRVRRVKRRRQKSITDALNVQIDCAKADVVLSMSRQRKHQLKNV